jgi:ABC-type antimicrobial peptide transport system permease subunit
VQQSAPTTVYWPTLVKNLWGARVFVARSVAFAIRSDRTGTESLLKEVGRVIWSVNSGVPLTEVRTLGDVYRHSMARTSFALVMLAIAAAMALLLALVGLYGVIAYGVVQRRREIGIRAALGAREGDLRRMFLRQGLLLALLGAVGGAAAATITTRVLSSLLFGISRVDPATYAAVAVLLAGATAIATYVPARRATRVDPAQTLRAD